MPNIGPPADEISQPHSRQFVLCIYSQLLSSSSPHLRAVPPARAQGPHLNFCHDCVMLHGPITYTPDACRRHITQCLWPSPSPSMRPAYRLMMMIITPPAPRLGDFKTRDATGRSADDGTGSIFLYMPDDEVIHARAASPIYIIILYA